MEVLNKYDGRAEFVKLCINDPKKGAEKLEAMAHGLANCRTTDDAIYALSSILHLSTRTIERDFFHKEY